jgi:DnaJ family protein C protein 9
MSLRHHPDKVTGDHDVKKESTEKFQVLSRIYSILANEEKKTLYDETGMIDGEDDENLFSSDIKDWEQYWRQMFKKISKEDIDGFFKNYQNSGEERADLLGLYEKHKGDIDLILEEMFSEDIVQDEERFRQIINDAIEKGDSKAHDKFVKESKRKANKRKAHYEKEAKEAEEMRKELGVDESQDSLRNAILSRRKAETENFLDRLAEKYGEKSNEKKKVGAGRRAASKIKQEDTSNQENESETEKILEEEEEEQDDEPKTKKRHTTKATVAKGKTARKVKRL